MPQSPLEVRFWIKVNKDGPIPTHCPELGCCWIWTASLDKRGYGQFGSRAIRVSPLRAHRVAWLLSIGPIPEGMCILHRCDNPACVNPSHLFPGDQKANVQDAMAKGRPVINYPGERNPMAKLTNSQVFEILSLGRCGQLSREKIAQRFGVCRRQFAVWPGSHCR